MRSNELGLDNNAHLVTQLSTHVSAPLEQHRLKLQGGGKRLASPPKDRQADGQTLNGMIIFGGHLYVRLSHSENTVKAVS